MPPTVFNPLSLWLTLPRDMGVSHTQWPPSITGAILACLWFAQGLHKAQKNQNSRAVLWCSGCFDEFNFTDWCNLFFQRWAHLKKYHSPLFTLPRTVWKVPARAEKSAPLYRGGNEFSILTGGTFTFKTVSPVGSTCVAHIFSKKDFFKWTQHYLRLSLLLM